VQAAAGTGSDGISRFEQLARDNDTLRRDNQGGNVRVLTMSFTDPGEEQSVIAEFNAARDAEVEQAAAELAAFEDAAMRAEATEPPARGIGGRLRAVES
jgi:hypothetical protein